MRCSRHQSRFFAFKEVSSLTPLADYNLTGARVLAKKRYYWGLSAGIAASVDLLLELEGHNRIRPRLNIQLLHLSGR